jgi:hypothetical protein
VTWVLLEDGAVIATGTYAQMLDRAEAWAACERRWHPDGTELAPRLARGFSLLPERMIADRRRAA